MTSTPSYNQATAQSAAVRDRVIAGLIDLVVGGALVAGLGLLLGLAIPQAFIAWPVAVAAVLVPRELVLALTGWSPGGRVMGVRLVDATTGGPPRTRLFIHADLLCVTVGLGAIVFMRSASADPRGQGWHDRMAGTMAVTLRSRPMGPVGGQVQAPTAPKRHDNTTPPKRQAPKRQSIRHQPQATVPPQHAAARTPSRAHVFPDNAFFLNPNDADPSTDVGATVDTTSAVVLSPTSDRAIIDSVPWAAVPTQLDTPTADDPPLAPAAVPDLPDMPDLPEPLPTSSVASAASAASDPVPASPAAPAFPASPFSTSPASPAFPASPVSPAAPVSPESPAPASPTTLNPAPASPMQGSLPTSPATPDPAPASPFSASPTSPASPAAPVSPTSTASPVSPELPASPASPATPDPAPASPVMRDPLPTSPAMPPGPYPASPAPSGPFPASSTMLAASAASIPDGVSSPSSHEPVVFSPMTAPESAPRSSSPEEPIIVPLPSESLFPSSTPPRSRMASRSAASAEPIISADSVPAAQATRPAVSASSPPAARGRHRHTEDPRASRLVPLTGGDPINLEATTVVGRDPDNISEYPDATCVSLNDVNRSISKTHAALALAPGGLWITDLHSTNGTRVEEEDHVTVVKPNESIPVPTGATIVLGSAAYRVED